MHFRTVAIINIIGLSVYVVVSIVCAFVGLHYWALVWGSCRAVCHHSRAFLGNVQMGTEPAHDAIGVLRRGSTFAFNVYFAFWIQLPDSEHR